MFKFCHVVELWITIKLKVCKMVRGILHIENTFNTIKASNLYCMSITIPLDLELIIRLPVQVNLEADYGKFHDHTMLDLMLMYSHHVLQYIVFHTYLVDIYSCQL